MGHKQVTHACTHCCTMPPLWSGHDVSELIFFCAYFAAYQDFNNLKSVDQHCLGARLLRKGRHVQGHNPLSASNASTHHHLLAFGHSLLWLARNGYNAQCLAARRIICVHSANSAGSRTVGFSWHCQSEEQASRQRAHHLLHITAVDHRGVAFQTCHTSNIIQLNNFIPRTSLCDRGEHLGWGDWTGKG